MIRYVYLSLMGMFLMYAAGVSAAVAGGTCVTYENVCLEQQKGKNAGNRNQFNPEAFQKELEAFIVREACLTPQEAEKFFPIYREMGKKQRDVFFKIRNISHTRPSDESVYKKCVTERDKLDIELKRIQQTYHNKFFTVLSAKKVFEVLRAEDRFHRRMLNKRSNNDKQKKGK